MHLYLANRKRMIFCFLENMKAVELPRPMVENLSETSSSSSSDSEEHVQFVREETERLGFKIPDRLQFFTSVQFMNLVLVIGGMQTYQENS